MPPFLLVFLGGGLGALARFGLVALARPHSPAFPTGTLIVNLSGCLAIGLLAGWLSRAGALDPSPLAHPAPNTSITSASATPAGKSTSVAAAPGTPSAPLAAPWSTEHWRLLLMVGVLGGYTTFSSFGLEVADMLRAGRTASAVAYILASVIGGVCLTLLGLLLLAAPSRTP